MGLHPGRGERKISDRERGKGGSEAERDRKTRICSVCLRDRRNSNIIISKERERE